MVLMSQKIISIPCVVGNYSFADTVPDQSLYIDLIYSKHSDLAENAGVSSNIDDGSFTYQ